MQSFLGQWSLRKVQLKSRVLLLLILLLFLSGGRKCLQLYRLKTRWCWDIAVLYKERTVYCLILSLFSYSSLKSLDSAMRFRDFESVDIIRFGQSKPKIIHLVFLDLRFDLGIILPFLWKYNFLLFEKICKPYFVVFSGVPISKSYLNTSFR